MKLLESDSHYNIYNIITKKYKPYSTSVDEITVGDKENFIATFYYKNKIILKTNYTILGTFSKEKNIWIWADQSRTLNKLMVNDISKIRNELLNNKNIKNTNIYNFINEKYSIWTTDNFFEIILNLNKFLGKDIFFSEYDTLIDVLIFNKILSIGI